MPSVQTSRKKEDFPRKVKCSDCNGYALSAGFSPDFPLVYENTIADFFAKKKHPQCEGALFIKNNKLFFILFSLDRM